MTAEPTPPRPADRDRRVTAAGVAGIAAGVFIFLALLLPRAAAFNALGVLGLIASPAPIAGLLLAGAGGSSRLALRALGAWLTAYVLLILAFVLAELFRLVSGSLSAVAAYLALPAALVVVVAGPVAAVKIALAWELPGWRRWIPLGLALAISLAMLPGLGVPSPAPVLILLMPIFLALTGAALVTLEPAPRATGSDDAVS
jgi:hypothetical protein